ncbi:CPBP family intramembrane metalloprotease, partial [Streptococcus vicugnae]
MIHSDKITCNYLIKGVFMIEKVKNSLAPKLLA